MKPRSLKRALREVRRRQALLTSIWQLMAAEQVKLMKALASVQRAAELDDTDPDDDEDAGAAPAPENESQPLPAKG